MPTLTVHVPPDAALIEAALGYAEAHRAEVLARRRCIEIEAQIRTLNQVYRDAEHARQAASLASKEAHDRLTALVSTPS